MVCQKWPLLLFLSVALLFTVTKLCTELVWSTIDAPALCSFTGTACKVITSEQLHTASGPKGKLFPELSQKNSTTTKTIGQLQSSAEKTTTTKKALSAILLPAFLGTGAANSTSISVHPERVNLTNFVTNQKASVARPPTKRSKSRLVTKMPTWFNIFLAHYPFVPTDKVQRVIVLTYFRSGSSFIGELLSSTPRTFYHFEPLRMFTRDSRIDASVLKSGLDLIGHLFRCEFQSVEHYVRSDYENDFLFMWNHFLWTLCGGQHSVCFNSDAVSKVCSRAPVHIMKLTRLHMSHVREFLRSNPDIAASVKILHLVRAPRGIVASRRRVAWCNTSESCVRPDTVCSEIRADLESYEELKKEFPKSVHRLRYEDLCLNPEVEAMKLFRVLGLNYTVHVSRYLKTHIKAQKHHALHSHSTWRNTSTAAFEWRTKLSYEDINEIQRCCSDVLLRLDYE